MEPIEELRYLVLAAQREGNRLFTESLQHLGLTTSQAEALRVLEQWAPVSLVELGSLLVCEQGSPSRLVAALIAAGYVERTLSPNDRRKVVLTLTSRGRDATAQVRAAEAALHAALSALVSDQEVADVLPIIRRIVSGRPAGDALARRLGRLPLLSLDSPAYESAQKENDRHA